MDRDNTAAEASPVGTEVAASSRCAFSGFDSKGVCDPQTPFESHLNRPSEVVRSTTSGAQLVRRAV